MASEMDIKRILKTLRLMRVFFKYRTTRIERKLMRMQADANVIEVNVDLEEKNLKKPLYKQSLTDIMIFNQESSAFESQN